MIIYASEVAACIGRNSYKSVDEMKKKVWKRTDQRSYEAAMKRQSLSLVQDELPACVNLSAAVACDAKDIPKQVAKILAQPVVPVTKVTVEAAKQATDLEDVIRLCKPTVKLTEAIEQQVNKAIVEVMQQKAKEAVSVREVKKADQVKQAKSMESKEATTQATNAKQACDARQKELEVAKKRAEQTAAARRQEAERAERLRRQALIDNKVREEAMKAQRALAEKARAEAFAKREAEMKLQRLKEAAEAKARAEALAKKKKEELERVATEAFITTAMQTAKVKDCVNLAGEVTGTVHKKRGIAGEDGGLSLYERTVGKRVKFRNETFYKKYITTNLAVGGFLDGVWEDETRIVEMKTRVNFMYRSNKEKIQLVTYLFLTGIHVGDLAQQLGDEMEIDTYTFDAQMWANICQSLISFADQVYDIIKSPAKQDALLTLLQQSGNTSDSK
jgi:hypothetical protein